MPSKIDLIGEVSMEDRGKRIDFLSLEFLCKTINVSQTDIPSKKVLDLKESKKIVDRECRFLSLELI